MTTQATSYQTISVRGADLAYVSSGRGQVPVVLSHANLTDLRSWDALVPHLEPHFRVVRYSRRYHWPNPAIAASQDDSWNDQADDLGALIEALQLGPVHVVGNSSSAYQALLLAARQPQLLRSVIAEEPPVIPLLFRSTPPSLGDLVSAFTTRPAAAFALASFGARTMGPATAAFARGDDERGLMLFARAVFGADRLAAMSAAQMERMHDNVAPHKAALLGTGLPAFAPEEARAIDVPVLLLTSEHASAFQKHLNRYLGTLLPRVSEHTVSGAGHFMHEDNPEEVARLIRDFVMSPHA